MFEVALRQLQMSYDLLLRERKLSLRPATLRIVASDTFWGQWDPNSRTISLAEKLVTEHPWFQVLGVLRHEIAHQLVTERPQELDCANRDPSAHGARFRAACQIIGVPEDFVFAGTDLQSEELDWRQRRQEEQVEKLLARTKKLLALATSSNEHEALLAMNKVRELSAKYNLENARSASAPRFAHIVMVLPKSRFEAHHRSINRILVTHFFVQVLSFRSYDAPTVSRRPAIEIIGTRENALMAEYVFHFLVNETEYLVREKAKLMPGTFGKLARKSYRLGVLAGFEEKLRVPAPDAAMPDAPVRSTELSVIGQAMREFEKDPRLDRYVSEIYPHVSRRAAPPSCIDPDVYFDGQAVGRTITLNRAVTERAGSQGQFLSHLS